MKETKHRNSFSLGLGQWRNEAAQDVAANTFIFVDDDDDDDDDDYHHYSCC